MKLCSTGVCSPLLRARLLLTNELASRIKVWGPLLRAHRARISVVLSTERRYLASLADAERNLIDDGI